MPVSRSPTTGERLLRVILVEDDQTYADMVRRLLLTKFDLQHAKSLAELLDLGRHDEPDVILLDLRLPDGGDYLALVMKVVARFRESAVLVTTGLDDETLALEALRAGAQDYLVKEIYVREQMVRKIVHAHARHAAALRNAESTAALAAAASSTSMHIAAVDPNLLEKKLEELVKKLINDEVLSKHHVRPRTDVFEPVPNSLNVVDFVYRLVRANWKFVLGSLAMLGVYLADFRDTVRNTAIAVTENAEAVEKITKATKHLEEKSKKENERLRNGLIYTFTTQVTGQKHLERMIETLAPKTDFPKSPPELRDAQDSVRDADAVRALFGDEDGSDAP